MADPLLHIKDGYFFEVPRFLWQVHYSNEKQVPEFIRQHYHSDANPSGPALPPLDEISHALSGKIVIPQIFGGKLENLHEARSGFCVSKFMVLEVVVAAILIVIFCRIAKKFKSGTPPRGRVWNLFEAILLYIRDQVVRPAIGGGHDDQDDQHGHDHSHSHGVKAHHAPFADADRFLPLLWTIFFFILGCNLMGLIPWMGAPTGEWGATLALAGVTLITVIVAGVARFGAVGFWLNQVPSMDLPILLWPIKILIFFIEVIGLLIKHAVLSIRLMANMVAGHVVILGILGLIVVAADASAAVYGSVATISVLGTTALTFLELFVALLQAYIFTFLSALFIGAAVHHH